METLKLGIDGLDDIEQIGAGGSSRVYRAKQVELDRLVALKVLKASDDPEVARRFDRERKAMGRLSLNEGIVPVYSSGITDRGEPYLIMPYYPNGSLQDRIEAGPVPWEEAVAYIASAAETMAAAHEADVVHLDLKPANILLSSNGAPRIADFGIAKLMSDQTASGNTGPAFTPTFTAPETLLGGEASPASDVYGLAATLWALIAGRPPFRAIDGEDNTLMAVVGRVVHQPAGDLRHLAPDPICAIIEIAMGKEPTDRYPTAGAFRQALAGAVAAASGPAAPAAPTVAAGPAGVAGAPAGEAGQVAPATAGQDATAHATAEQAQAAQSSLQFDAAVPPRLVPAGNARAAGLADAVDRYSGVVVGLGVAAILLIAVFLGQRLLAGDDTAATDSSTQIVQANESTSSSGLSAQAGAGGADNESDDELAGPTTTSTTQASTTATSAATVSVTTTPTSATTESSTTTTTEETTSSTEDPTSTTEDTTSTTEDTTSSSSETTETTTSSSSSSSTETTDTTVVIPRLDPPQSVTASYIVNRVVIGWNPPADADGLTGFTVLRDGVPITSTGPAVIRFVDRDLPDTAPGTTYVYQVRADGPADGNPRNSVPSAGVTVEIPEDDDDPNVNEPADDPADGP